MTIIVNHTISMGHRLPTYKGICSSPHGHNVTVATRIETAEFLDFKEVSDELRQILQDFDHAMVLHVSDPLVEALAPFGFRLVLLNVEPSTENIAQHVFNELVRSSYDVQEVTVHETAKYAASVYLADDLVQRILMEERS